MQAVAEVEVETVLAEVQSARHAAHLAEESATEARALAKVDPELAAEWGKAAKLCSSIALGHYTRAAKLMPGSELAREAKDHAALAVGFARMAEMAVAA